MDVHELTLMIGTGEPEAMVRFYGEVLGLPCDDRYADPVFKAGGASIRILNHAGISGRSGEPARMQINLFVTAVREEWERLSEQGVRFVREPEEEWWGGVVATMEDPDGNFVQIIEGTGKGQSSWT
jgi:catechol 2,3-dioxygenase-like lactoylglutathione lyase family enzyme